MSYQNYVIAAYAVFAIAMLWDWLAPKLQIRQLLRATQLRAKQAGGASHGRHPRESGDPVP